MSKSIRKNLGAAVASVKSHSRARGITVAAPKAAEHGRSATASDTEYIGTLKGGVNALIAGLPRHCRHTLSGLRVRVREIMQQANETPQVVENVKTNARYVLLHEDVLAHIIESLRDPVAALMNEFATRGRSAALPEGRPRYHELRAVQAPNVEKTLAVKR